jgi:hypothetical protein
MFFMQSTSHFIMFKWKLNQEEGAFIGAIFDSDRALMLLDTTVGDGETKTGSCTDFFHGKKWIGGARSHSPSGRLSSWTSIRRPRRSNVAANCAAWIDIIFPFMECKKGQACARLSPVPEIGLHADSIQHATSVPGQIQAASRSGNAPVWFAEWKRSGPLSLPPSCASANEKSRVRAERRSTL